MAFFPNESDLPQSPLITNEEIISYQLKWDSASNDSVYILELKDAGIDKVRHLTNVGVRQGKPFALCVNRKPVFGGYFWSPFSSYSCDWIVIPLNSLNGGYSI
ncbi:hypothetical protein, partial [Escherichia coli]|uniref:hypothetical protein n=1 Tax=Escherichia coli TaxID=562 RepID=UPI001BDD00F5